MKHKPSSHHSLQDFAATERLKARVDSDGETIIPGKLGHIYEYDDCHFAVMVAPFPYRKNYWGITRKNLVTLGFEIVQDGDCEGAALFDPANPEQAKAAIRAAGVSHKRQLSEAQVNKQITWLRASAGGVL